MREIYRKFTSIDEARDWGKKNYSYWLPKYQLDGKLRRNYDTENPERYLKGDFSEEEIRELRVDALENKWFSFYCGGNWGLAINEKTDMVIRDLLFQKMNLWKCKWLWIIV